jgi:hypothetical protein
MVSVATNAGLVTEPVKVGLARGAAPIVLYEIVCAALPLNVVPDVAPEPLLFIVSELVVVPPPPPNAVHDVPLVPAPEEL